MFLCKRPVIHCLQACKYESARLLFPLEAQPQSIIALTGLSQNFMGSGISKSETEPENEKLKQVKSWSEYKFIHKEIHSHTLCMFSKSTCSYCRRAKELLEENKVRYHSINIDKLPFSMDLIQRVLWIMTGSSTVPRIFIRTQCIGGYEELRTLVEEEKLQSLLDK